MSTIFSVPSRKAASSQFARRTTGLLLRFLPSPITPPADRQIYIHQRLNKPYQILRNEKLPMHAPTMTKATAVFPRPCVRYEAARRAQACMSRHVVRTP